MQTLQITLQHQRYNQWPVTAILESRSLLPVCKEGFLDFPDDWEARLKQLQLIADQYGFALQR